MDGKKLILLVDDDPVNLKRAQLILAKEGYGIAATLSGKQALQFLEKNRPDIILLDINMPEMDGFEVLECIKARDEWKDIPVIFLTADNDQETEVRGLRAGALDFVTKPFMEDIVKQRVKHLVELDHLQKQLKEEVARQTAKAEERRKQVEEMSFQTVHALADAIDAKDSYTKGHSARVAEYSIALAEELGWTHDEINDLKYVALLHDIGKIGVPDAVLNKPGKLTEVEYSVIKSHTTTGAEILKSITTVVGAVQVARHHHERYDGTGYPDHLKGEDIPIMARVVCIADAYDAMNSKRIYRNSMSKDYIREELLKCSGTQFDPNMVEAFVKVLDEGKLDEYVENNVRIQMAENSAALLSQVMKSAFDSGYSSHTDALTGLPLRAIAEQKIKAEMKECDGTLFLVDLDNLKKVNDIYGHTHGDTVLRHIGDVLAAYSDAGVAARLGGDEFLLYLPITDRVKIEDTLRAIYAAFAERIAGNVMFASNSLSIGICMTTTTDEFSDVYGNADKALYFAKQNGKGKYHFYEKKSEFDGEKPDTDLNTLINTVAIAGDYSGAMKVEFREFTQLFEFIRNLKKRYEHEVQLTMITLATEDNSPMQIEKIENAVNAMENAIKNTIRTVDVCTRYSNMQFLVILVGTTADEVPVVMNRIFEDFYKTYVDGKIKLTYSSSVLE